MEHREIVSGPTVVQSGTLTTGSAVVTGLTTAALAGALQVSGTGVPIGTFVSTIDTASQVTLTANATATGSASLTFTLEPIGLAEAKRHLRLETTADDSLIPGMIQTARMHAELLTKETLLLTTYDWYLDGFPASANGYFNRNVRQMGPNPQWLPNGAAILFVPKGPLVSVASVKYVDTSGTLATIDPSTYVVSTGRGCRIQPIVGSVWPVARPQIDGVVVRYTAGAANASLVPENVKTCMKLMVGHLYENRELYIAGQGVSMVSLAFTEDALIGENYGGYS